MESLKKYFKKDVEKTPIENEEIEEVFKYYNTTTPYITTSGTYAGAITAGYAGTSSMPLGSGGTGASTYTIPSAAGISGSILTPGSGISSGTWATASTPYVRPGAFSISDAGKEIVTLNKDGSVIWNEDIDIDKAAEAFSKSLVLGAELAAGITKTVKLKMRDSVFEDLIKIAEDKGSLTAEDLTYLLSASKIVEKLQGGKN